jgi:hypothetical protein
VFDWLYLCQIGSLYAKLVICMLNWLSCMPNWLSVCQTGYLYAKPFI